VVLRRQTDLLKQRLLLSNSATLLSSFTADRGAVPALQFFEVHAIVLSIGIPSRPANMRQSKPRNFRFLGAFAAIGLTIGLFVVGGRPEAGQIFKGHWHWVAHLLIYALIACAYGLALPRLDILSVAAIVAAIGGFHEFYEIEAHGHDFETADLLVNAAGALIGALAGALFGSLSRLAIPATSAAMKRSD
jgi:VanZ family protein